LIVAFAAVGSTLIAGTQLSDLGALATGSGRFWIAVTGAAVAIAAIIAAVILVSSVLVVAPVGLSDLAGGKGKYEKIREAIDRDPALVPAGDVTTLKNRYVKAQRTQLHTYWAWTHDPENPDLTKKKELADGELRLLELLMRNVLDVAQFFAVANAYTTIRWRLVAAVILAMAGVIAFATAANPPPSNEPERVAVSRPGVAVVELSAAGRRLLGPQLGCASRRLPAVILAVNGSEVEVVTQATGDCRPVRVTIDPRLGTVVGA
jgi:hypothetical protein